MTQTADRNSVRTQTVRDLFGVRRALIGMIHVGALPGTPAARHDLDALVGTAIEEARIYQSAGFHALMIENMHDRPYLNGVGRPRNHRGDDRDRPRGAARGAAAARGPGAGGREPRGAGGGARVRRRRSCAVEGFVFAHVADEGLIERRRRRAAPVSQRDRSRRHAGVRRHQEEAFGACDDGGRRHRDDRARGRVLPGRRRDRQRGRDRPADRARSGPGGSRGGDDPGVRRLGSDAGQRSKEYADADGFIIGSSAKRDGYWSNPVDPARVAAFTAAHAKLETS